MTDVQAKRDALELAVLFKSDQNPVGRDAILRAFEYMLADYVRELLSPDLDDARALHTRAKALGVIDTLTKMGVDIADITKQAPVRRSVNERIHESLNLR